MTKPNFPVASVVENEPLAGHTTWRVGGPARWFWEPESADELPGMLRFCHENDIPVYYLGRGSNVLVADEGLDGLVICTMKALQEMRRDGDRLVAEAGVALPKLSSHVSSLGYAGYEFLIGVPGNVGGGTVINAGLTSQGPREMKDVLLEVEVVTPEGEVERISVGDLAMGYRTSRLLGTNAFVLRATFVLREQGAKEAIREQTKEHLQERRRKQPLTKKTAGSTFKQPADGRAAGWYIDRAGMKGKRVGNAVVSEVHANWIENEGGEATAAEVKALMNEMREAVQREFGVELEREVRLLPEDGYSTHRETATHRGEAARKAE